MGVEIGFNEGKVRIFTPGGGMPAHTHFALVRNAVAANLSAPVGTELYAGSAYADMLECVGTGYARIDLPTPAPSADAVISYLTTLLWAPAAGVVNWSNDVHSLVALDNALSLLIYAWDLTSMLGRDGGPPTPGVAFNMSTPFETITVVQPLRIFLQNVGGN